MNPHNPFQGRWKIECQVRTDDGQWDTFRKFFSDDCVWEFQTENSFSYQDPDEQAYNGIFTEHFGAESVAAEYGYLKNAGRLYIERRDKSYIHLYYKDIFQVVKTETNEFILYELRDDNDESDDHLCRLTLKKLSI